MTQIIEQLAALAEKAPNSCRRGKFGSYEMGGEYKFNVDSSGEFYAIIRRYFVSGRPALAWLADAISMECDRLGWYWEVRYWSPCQKFQAEIANKTVWAATVAEALLTAFLAAVEGER